MEPWKNTLWQTGKTYGFDDFPVPSDEAIKRHSCIFIVVDKYSPLQSRTRYANTWDHWHLTPSSAPSISMPEPQYNFIDAPGSNHKLDVTEVLTGYVPFGQRTGSIGFYVETGYIPRDVLKSEIANFFGGNKTKMILCDDPAYYYEGRVVMAQFGMASDGSGSTVVLNYVFEPYKRWRCSTTEQWTWDPFNFYRDRIPKPETFKDIKLESHISERTGETVYDCRQVTFESDFMPTTVTFTANADLQDHQYFDVSYSYQGMATVENDVYSDEVQYSHRLTTILTPDQNDFCLITDNTYGTAPIFVSTDVAEFTLEDWVCVAKAYSDPECTNLICDYGVTEGYLPFNATTNDGKQTLNAVQEAYYRFEFWRTNSVYGAFNDGEYGQIVSNFRVAREDGSDYRLTAALTPLSNAGNNEPFLATTLEHSVPFYLTQFDVAEFTLDNWWCVAKAYTEKECLHLLCDYGTDSRYLPFNATTNEGKQQLSAVPRAFYRFEFWRDSHTMDPITPGEIRAVLSSFKINCNAAPVKEIVPKSENYRLYSGQTVIPDLVIRPNSTIMISISGSGTVSVDYRGGRL